VRDDDPVERAQQRVRQPTQDAPTGPERFEQVTNRAGARQETLGGKAVVGDYVDRVEVARVLAVTREQSAGEGALQRGEAQSIFAVALQEEADGAVAHDA